MPKGPQGQTAEPREETSWLNEEVWLRARQQRLDQIKTWRTSEWIYTGNRMYRGVEKLKHIAKLEAGLARLEARGAPEWRERLHAQES